VPADLSCPFMTIPPDDRGDALERLERQLAFVREIDRLKSVLRRTSLHDGLRATYDYYLGSRAPDAISTR